MLCVRVTPVSFSEEVKGIIYLEFHVGASCWGPEAPTEGGLATDWVTPQLPLLFSPPLPSPLSFFCTEANHPFFTFTVIHTIFFVSFGLLFGLSYLQFRVKCSKWSKERWDHISLILPFRKQEPGWEHSLSLLDWFSFALPKPTPKACSNLFSDMTAPLNWPARGVRGS